MFFILCFSMIYFLNREHAHINVRNTIFFIAQHDWRSLSCHVKPITLAVNFLAIFPFAYIVCQNFRIFNF
jgi:hypothetical protein